MDDERDDGAHVDGSVELDGCLACAGVVSDYLGQDLCVLLDL